MTLSLTPAMAVRRDFFAKRDGNRYWWHRRTGDAYVPDVYAALSDEEFALLATWYEETDAQSMIGECAIPAIAWLSSFISANNIDRVVQLGSYAGYSGLLLGWTLRRMGKKNALIAIDVDQPSLDFCTGWIKRAGLEEQVRVHLCDSSDPALPKVTSEYLGGAPQLVFIDSSHQYAHTVRELDLWYEHLAPAGIIALHDTSEYAASFDSTNEGGVRRALNEWRARTGAVAFSLANSNAILADHRQVYMDGCGLGLIVKDAS
jgi:predicted O-methyltransferase YrrM